MAVLFASVFAMTACAASTEPQGPSADVRGAWSYSGTQASPVRELAGTLVVSAQVGADVSGSLSWEERDGLGGVISRSAPISGRIIGMTDADFDVMAPDATRRHVARLSSNLDTLEGIWIATTLGQNGSFKAVRSAVP